ncbi:MULTISPECIES: DUF3173 family protein [Enterococcus]|uniref:DUF3173 domain-containing protein n=1 Tax=Enterococcus thailandicus TaxID=417368 RepID=A0A179ERH4_ENTTH|nr:MULTISPECIES: DUF3173 family protein [Enterococcus]MBD9901167.1 DUF3173 family protein [Enterococcus faecium]OAQ55838.1 hypothetical protein A6E74_07170 [Enterococcus thailandicus]RBS51701.1 hypothetical protein EB25_00070 [Enterococcus faecium]TNX06362.1 DUF3173 domain-containing protein [Enterococcus faecium]
MLTISVDDLVKMGYPKQTAQNIYKQVRYNLVADGYNIYKNKQIRQVPTKAVEKVLGYSLSGDTEGEKNAQN